MRTMSLVLAVAMMAGCASVPPAEVDAKMRAWEGIHINELMNAWGPPTNQYQAAGHQYFSWSSQSTDSGGPSFGIGLGSYGTHSGGSVGTSVGGGYKTVNCQRSAELDPAGKVVAIRWNGDSTYCNEVTPKRL